MLAISLKAIKENLISGEFEDLLEAMQEANNKEKLDFYLSRAQELHSKGTDLATAFSHAFFDALVDTGKIY